MHIGFASQGVMISIAAHKSSSWLEFRLGESLESLSRFLMSREASYSTRNVEKICAGGRRMCRCSRLQGRRGKKAAFDLNTYARRLLL